MSLLNSLILHRNDRTCQERGVCKSKTGRCRKECHLAEGEPPIGYESAYVEEDSAGDVRADRIIAGIVVVVLLAFGIIYSIFTPDSILHQLGGFALINWR